MAAPTKCRHCGGPTTASWESRWALCSLCSRFTHKADLERRIPDPIYLRCHNCGEGEFCKCSAASDAAYLQRLVRMGRQEPDPLVGDRRDDTRRGF